MDVSMPVPTSVWQPGSLEEAWSLKKELDGVSRFIAGGTLMQMQREQGVVFPPHLISLEQLRELADIEETVDGSIRIGALTDLETCRTHLLVKKMCPSLSEAIGTIASPAVRNRGTIGGNILYGIGDAIPILLAMDARLSWFCENGIRSEWLSDYVNGQESLEEGAILTDITIPSLVKGHCFFRKIGRRETFIPSIVTVAMYMEMADQNVIRSIRIVAGGGVNTPRRLRGCEEMLVGKQLTDDLLSALSIKIKEESALIGDVFASANYRRTVAANLLLTELQSVR
ncbi:xanthine dehydrogenase family protein subunit M [Domibacillus sp. A3M-37]|uniref:FAD binding domain-containing protein n=1 Tax=Domibacillus TaxID=1433999 RepID=UPI0020B892DE|nr:FAD binding domain-containing protein [Domibacillus sp. A3M-37]MCP3763607.1 xanthine dehydrogenase family protein subunit M [Domibacillus sp. A3M-37]